MYKVSIQYNTKRQLNLKKKMSLAALKSFVHRLDYLTWMPSKVSHRIFTISFNKGRFFSKMLQKNWNTFLFICVLLYSTNRTIFLRQKWMNQFEHFFIKLSQIYCSILNEERIYEWNNVIFSAACCELNLDIFIIMQFIT